MLQSQHRQAFTLSHLRILDSRDIWLSVDDISDCRMDDRKELGNDIDWLGLKEANRFKKQLFYWLLNRRGECLFHSEVPLEGGVPVQIPERN